MMIEILENIFIFLILFAMTFFAFMSSHLVSEKKAGHTIPLPWERKNAKKSVDSKRSKTNGKRSKKQNANVSQATGVFDKSKIKYRDGDNT